MVQSKLGADPNEKDILAAGIQVLASGMGSPEDVTNLMESFEVPAVESTEDPADNNTAEDRETLASLGLL